MEREGYHVLRRKTGHIIAGIISNKHYPQLLLVKTRSNHLNTLAKGKPRIGVLEEIVAIAPQLDWWHTYLAILRVEQYRNGQDILSRSKTIVLLLPHPNYTLQSDREEEVPPLQLLFQPAPLPEQCCSRSRLSPQRSRKCSKRHGCLFSSQLTVGREGEVKNISPSFSLATLPSEMCQSEMTGSQIFWVLWFYKLSTCRVIKENLFVVVVFGIDQLGPPHLS